MSERGKIERMLERGARKLDNIIDNFANVRCEDRINQMGAFLDEMAEKYDFDKEDMEKAERLRLRA